MYRLIDEFCTTEWKLFKTSASARVYINISPVYKMRQLNYLVHRRLKCLYRTKGHQEKFVAPFDQAFFNTKKPKNGVKINDAIVACNSSYYCTKSVQY